MQPSDYYPEGLQAANPATSANCVAQAAEGALSSLGEAPAASLHRGPHPARRLPISTLWHSQYSHKGIYLVHQQNLVCKPSILAAVSALRTISWGLVCEPYLYIYTLNVKYTRM